LVQIFFCFCGKIGFLVKLFMDGIFIHWNFQSVKFSFGEIRTKFWILFTNTLFLLIFMNFSRNFQRSVMNCVSFSIYSGVAGHTFGFTTHLGNVKLKKCIQSLVTKMLQNPPFIQPFFFFKYRQIHWQKGG
jgi:hypothetical protein